HHWLRNHVTTLPWNRRTRRARGAQKRPWKQKHLVLESLECRIVPAGPTLTTPPSQVFNQGSHLVNLATLSDPSDTGHRPTATGNWGTGQARQSCGFAPGAQSHTHNNQGKTTAGTNYPVSISVTDTTDSDTSNTVNFEVKVKNVAPTPTLKA